MGITSVKRPDPREVRDFDKEPLTSGERLRLVYDLITGLPDVTKGEWLPASFLSSLSFVADQLGGGAGITPQCKLLHHCPASK
jgi:hypothetical protein